MSGLRHAYGPVEILHGLDLEVPTGTTTAILGPSGCGKSTLLLLVAGFGRPASGRVSIAGDVVVGGGRWVPPQRRQIGYVAQEGALFPHLTVRRNLEFGLARADRNRARLLELLDLVSLEVSHLERYPDELSGGQQQRVALARTLARRPVLVLLDEPFSALDTDLRAATRTAVAAALRASGVTTVLVTHDRGEALSFADAVAVMVEGRFTQVADPRTLYEYPADLTTAALVGATVVLPGRVVDGRAITPLGSVRLRAGGDQSETVGPSVTTWSADGADMPARGTARMLAADPARAHADAQILLRPEQIGVRPDADGRGRVTRSDYFGPDRVLEVSWPELPEPVRARVSGAADLSVGDRVEALIEGTALAFAA